VALADIGESQYRENRYPHNTMDVTMPKSAKANAQTPVDVAHELLLAQHPDVREEYERLRPRYELVAALIRARKEAGVTQAELAERMGRPQSVISEVESGRRSPRLDTLAHAARVLGFELRVELVRAAGDGEATR
jgi:ribosome-binding protein aMBF1 (putative translation factor)